MKKNVIVGQSGGPTSAINASLAGIYSTAVECGANKVYGMMHGIEGLLQERYIDLSAHLKDDLDIEMLKRTPAAFLGSCRYKLPPIEGNEETYDKIFAILDKLEIEAFFYIGGNDSMDTINKLSKYAVTINHPCRFVGCPKTIDNDLAHTDHTPGFGSAAKYIAASVKEVIRDALCMEYKNGFVVIIEVMGRNAGWLTAASALSKTEDCEGPDMIYLPEVAFDVDAFKAKVKDLLKEKDVVVAVVSEGIRNAEGTYVCELGSNIGFVDAFGHKQLSGTASTLGNILAAEIGCKTRSIEFSTLQRAAAHFASLTDINEAFMVAGAAVRAADAGETGKMAVYERLSQDPYLCGTSIKDVDQIANDEKVVPREWINEAGDYVTQAFIDYAKPLIQGEVTPLIADGIPRHLMTPKELGRQ